MTPEDKDSQRPPQPAADSESRANSSAEAAPPTRRLDGAPPLRPATLRPTDGAQRRPAPSQPTRRLPTVSPSQQPSVPESPPPAEPTRRLPAAPPQQRPPVPESPPPADPTRRIPTHPPASHSDTRAIRTVDPYGPPPIRPYSSVGDPANPAPLSAEPTRQVVTHPGYDYGPTMQMSPPPSPPPPPPPAAPASPPAGDAEGETSQRIGKWASWLLSITLVGVSVFFLAIVGAVVGYVVIAAQLPPPEELRAREPTFASSQIFDRDGRLLHEIIDPTAGRRTYVPLGRIAPELLWATVATEDRNFYAHVGFDPFAIARAVYYAIQEREIVSGASTVTQQVARNILLENTDPTVSRKVQEIILAAELERRYSKDEIMEVYLNNNNYGNLAYGIDAAARTYFGITAADLNLAQASFLAGIPQSPATYNPFGGGRDLALRRHKVVLRLMVEDGYITQEQADAAAAEMETHDFIPTYTDRIPAPHFVVYVQQWVEKELGREALYTGNGLRIYTTLDRRMQQIAEEEVARGVAALAGRHATNGALTAIEPSSGHILAMVGSVDFYNVEIGGQVNVTQRCRQPGSAIKPLTFLTAFEQNWTPATIVWDTPVTYTDTAGNVYEPRNFDRRFRGPMSVRDSLANSLNIPAVKALEYVGVDGLLEMADRLGATSIVSPQLECPDYPHEHRPQYGLALTLGGGEMKPLELTSAYATFANGGLYMAPTPILWIEDSNGNVLPGTDNRARRGEQVVNIELAYLLTHILADTRARCEVFACPSVMELPGRPAAAKTGSTNDTRDAWTVGYTPDIAVGVWVGNNDNTPMQGVLGSSGAGPIWNAFMRRAHEGLPVQNFPRPAGIVERSVCAFSGAEPATYCPETRAEIFSLDVLPPSSERDWFQEIEIDAASGLRANEDCRLHIEIKRMLVLDNVRDPGGRKWLREWAEEHQWDIAPPTYCTGEEGAPTLIISRPQTGDEVFGLVEILGTVEMPDFEEYILEFGVSANPEGWGRISGPHHIPVTDGRIGVWEIPADMPPGTYTIRLLGTNQRGARFEARVIVTVPEPTPTPTPEDTDTPTPTLSPTPTLTPTPTPIPLDTETPTPTPTPLPPGDTLTPTPTPTPAPLYPTETPTPTPTSPPAPPPEEPPPPTPPAEEES